MGKEASSGLVTILGGNERFLWAGPWRRLRRLLPPSRSLMMPPGILYAPYPTSLSLLPPSSPALPLPLPAPYPPPSYVRTAMHKVWILDCKSCRTFLTNRGMKVRHSLLSHSCYLSRFPCRPCSFFAQMSRSSPPTLSPPTALLTLPIRPRRHQQPSKSQRARTTRRVRVSASRRHYVVMAVEPPLDT